MLSTKVRDSLKEFVFNCELSEVQQMSAKEIVRYGVRGLEEYDDQALFDYVYNFVSSLDESDPDLDSQVIHFDDAKSYMIDDLKALLDEAISQMRALEH